MESASASPGRVTLTELTFTFVPFGLLLAAALLLPETAAPEARSGVPGLDEILGVNDPELHPVPKGTPVLPLYRAILSVWVASLLLIPAVCLYVLPARSASRRRYALLFWTFSFLAYLVHVWYAAFVIFGGVRGTFDNMRLPIAATNFFLTGWWALDVLLAWLAPPWAWVRLERTAAHIFVFLVFVVTELFLRPTAVRYVALALAASVAVCLLVRLSHPTEPAVVDTAQTPSGGPV